MQQTNKQNVGELKLPQKSTRLKASSHFQMSINREFEYDCIIKREI